MKTSRGGLVANDPLSSTVAFVGTGPSARSSITSAALISSRDENELAETTRESAPMPRVLYVAATYVPSAQGPRESMRIPSMASLSLEPGRVFDYTSETISASSMMRLDFNKVLFYS